MSSIRHLLARSVEFEYHGSLTSQIFDLNMHMLIFVKLFSIGQEMSKLENNDKRLKND